MSEAKVAPAPEAQKKATAVGKRFLCTRCGFEFIVTRGGGEIRCCGQPVVPKK
ncbi:MAG: desulforedoxin [Deltaproteobacteria bacterium]|nr:desulforedoxin [Deltaproteobacteria bacterium]